MIRHISTNYFAACVLSAVVSAFSVAWFMSVEQKLSQYDAGFQSGFAQGLKTGGEEALRVNPVSARLEEACTSIWISEQIVEQHRRASR
jgi:hypothetical protein